MKKLFIFFASSVSSALLNYLFQVLLAYKIGPAEFSQFTLNWSYFGLASMLGGFFQYWASLNQISAKDEKSFRKIVHVLAIALIISSIFFNNIYFLILSIVVEGIAMAFIMGRAVSRGDFKTVNVINVSLSLIRVLLLLAMPSVFLNSKKIFYIVLTSLLLVEIICNKFLFSPEQLIAIPLKKKTADMWLGPLLFSFLICTLPQVDIIWVHWFKPLHTLNLISELSFITKGLFFFQLIVAQWLFPKQLLDSKSQKLNLTKYQIIFFIVLIVGSLMGSYVLPFVITRFLSWTTIPSRPECFWAGFNAGMMSLFYQFCQINIIRNKFNDIFLSLLALLVVFAITGLSDLSLVNYFIVSSATYLMMMGISMLRERNGHSVDPT